MIYNYIYCSFQAAHESESMHRTRELLAYDRFFEMCVCVCLR